MLPFLGKIVFRYFFITWYTVTFVRFLDTLPKIRTLELIRQTRYRRTIFFILFIEAIVIAVADPRLWYTVTCSRTRELEVGARLLSAEVTFIRSIAAVVFAEYKKREISYYLTLT